MHVAPEVDLTHLDRLTDSTGLIQHAIYCVPRRESGYTVDDNARALRLCVALWRRRPQAAMLDRVTKYLSLLEFARRPGGGFHNLMSYQRQWLDADSRGDCQGQAVRGLAEVLASDLPDDYRMLARELIDSATPTLAELRSLRAQAYVVIAYVHLWQARVRNLDALRTVARLAADNLVDCYRRSRRPDWNWFESRMTYANAVLSHGLFAAARRWPDDEFLACAEESLTFLDQETTTAGYFCPVGNHGWYSRGEAKAVFDQQPVEAGTMADAASTAASMCVSGRYAALFWRAHAWFQGRNSLEMPVFDERSQGCCDGLQARGLNRNQGAESTLAYLTTNLLALSISDLRPAGEAASAPVISANISSGVS